MMAKGALKGNMHQTVSDGTKSVVAWYIHVKVRLLAEMLGTKAMDPEVFKQFILSKGPGGSSAKVETYLAEKTLDTIVAEHYAQVYASKKKDGEEVTFYDLSDEDKEKAVEAATAELQGRSVYHRDESGDPIIYDYQIKGHLKAIADDFRRGCKKGMGGKGGKLYGLDWPPAPKKRIDTTISVYPRCIPVGKVDGTCERPLRAESWSAGKGYQEIVSLASSETVPEGTEMEFVVALTGSCEFRPEHIGKILDYGLCHGYGQWRNSGKGIFAWECLGEYEPGDDLTPINHLLDKPLPGQKEKKE
jgi:hypothetical protein